MAQNKQEFVEYKMGKEDLNELSSSERKTLSDIERKVADYTMQKANIDKQYQVKKQQLMTKRNAINNMLKRCMNSNNSKLSLRAASIYHTINSSES